MRQGGVPGISIRTVQLHVQHVFMAFPGFVQQEAVLIAGIAVQHRRVIVGLVLHRIQHEVQTLQKLLAPVRHDLELDQIGNGHGLSLTRDRIDNPG
jgi:hypothetical protein